MSTCLPTLCAPGLPDVERAQAPGGFTWWYVDLVDERGDGLVVIVALGLPFLPGYASAARAARPQRAIERPSVCVSHVVGGRLAFWALHETDPAKVDWRPGSVRLGDQTVDVALGADTVRFEAHLAGELPGAPWSLSLTIEGPRRKPTPGEPVRAAHEWSVMTVMARGTARLSVAGRETLLEGRAYLDRNAGDGTLEALDVARWSWGRLAFPDRERIWYEAVDRSGVARSLALSITGDGVCTLERDGVVPTGVRHGWWALPCPASVQVDEGLRVDLPAPLDDSPFYARFRVDADDSGAIGRGFAEVCVPGRIDAAWFRPLLSMTVCHDHAPAANSMWLPLFGGPREGRLQRLVGW